MKVVLGNLTPPLPHKDNKLFDRLLPGSYPDPTRILPGSYPDPTRILPGSYPDRAGQGRAGQGRAGQGRAGQGQSVPSVRTVGPSGTVRIG